MNCSKGRQKHQNGLNLFSSPGMKSKMAKPMADGRAGSPVITEIQSSDRTTQTREEETTPPDVNHTAVVLGNDIVNYLAKQDNNCPNKYAKYCKTLRRTAEELSSKHEILFKSMVNRLKTFEHNGYESFKSVIDEIFQDRQVNWGRIVTVYTFGGTMAKYYYEHGREADADRVSEFLGLYVGHKLGKWIHKNGGWDAFVNYFPDPKDGENQVWKGLLYTAVGLGALATTLVAVR